MNVPTKPFDILKTAFAAGLAMALITGCTTGPSPLEDNSGQIFSTQPGESIETGWLYGKWDLDGERTNAANGAAGVLSIPSDVIKDVLGEGMRFESNGVVKFDRVIGWQTGAWSLEAPATVTLRRPGYDTTETYTAHFRDGYLYLKRADTGRTLVFERDKFFGF